MIEIYFIDVFKISKRKIIWWSIYINQMYELTSGLNLSRLKMLWGAKLPTSLFCPVGGVL